MKDDLSELLERGAPTPSQPLDTDTVIRDGQRRRGRRRAGKLTAVTLAVALGLAAIGGTVYAGRGARGGSTVRTAARGTPAPEGAQPRTFVDILGNRVQLRSSATGKVLRNLTGKHWSVGGQTSAFSPGGRYVYVPLYSTVDKKAVIARFPTAGGPPKVVAVGQMPALSANGHLLASVTGPTARTVRVVDLLTGRTRRFDLAKTIGRAETLSLGSVAWLGDTSELLLWPQPGAGSEPNTTKAGYGVCHFLTDHPRTGTVCLIALHPFSRHPDPHAMIVPYPKWFVPSLGGDVTDGALMFSGGTAAPRSVLLDGTNASGSHAVLARVRFAGTKPTVSLDVSFANSHPAVSASSGIGLLALDSSNTHLLYLLTNYRCHHTKKTGLECNDTGSPSLWVGTIKNARLVHTHRLITHTQMDALAW